MTPESSIGVPADPDSSAIPAVDSPSTSQGTGAPPEQPVGSDNAPVQDSQPPADDALTDIPSLDELKAQENVPYAKGLAQLRQAYESLKPQLAELQGRFSPFESVADKFSAPEEVQQLVDMRESLLGWERDDKGQLVPSTQAFIEKHLDPQRAEFLFADLADGLSPNGQPRMDRALQFIATDPERRANALKILGAVEPSAVAPQWQATEEQLAVVRDDLKDTFKKLPYDEREELATMSPEFINNSLAKQKLQDDLIADREQRTQQDAQLNQQREQMAQAEAARAGDDYVRTQLDTALTTFHKSVVEQCRLIEPLDPQNPPQGMDAAQVAAMNTQIDQSNKADAVQVSLAVIGVINEQTRPFVLPLLRELGIVDDKFLEQLDSAGKAFGDNARNYGHLTYSQKLGRNGTYSPGADVTMLNTESGRNLKLLAYYANQISKKLIEAKSATFSMKATGHNAILNGVATSRPLGTGSAFDPTKAAPQANRDTANPWPTRAELERQYS